MGGETLGPDKELLPPPSQDVWHFEIESIYDHGAYVIIAERLVDLTRGDLGFDRIADYVDIEAEITWIELTQAGRPERLDLVVRNNWIDYAIFTHLQECLVASGSPRRFAIESLGQDMLIVCQTPQALQSLNRLTGLLFHEA